MSTQTLSRSSLPAEPVRGTARKMLRKVPEVTVWFWVIKVLCTTVGETFADFLTSNVFHDSETSTALFMGVFLIAVLIAQFKARKYIPGVYWLAVVLISVVGTLITDNMVDHMGVTLVQSTILWAILLGCTFFAWHRVEGTLSIHSIYTTRREAFYWLTILFTFALGTASGDLIAEKFAIGYSWSVLLFAGMIGLIAIAHFYWKLNGVFAFWACYILTRPLGASIGDLLSQPHVPLSSDPTAAPGLGLGTTVTSIIFLAAILGVVIYLSVTKADVEEMTEEHLRAHSGELLDAAREVLGRGKKILAAGIFGVQNVHGAALVSDVARGNPVEPGLALASAEGVELRTLIAVTDSSIHALDWDGVGHTAQELMTFPRSTTSVQITKFGTTQHLNIVDTASGQRIGLTGTSGHNPEATGDKLVIHLLGESAEA